MNLLTTIGEGLRVEVSFDYEASERANLFGNQIHPASRAKIDITCISAIDNAAGYCILDSLNTWALERIEAECFKQVDKEAEEANEALIDYQSEAIISRGEYWKRG